MSNYVFETTDDVTGNGVRSKFKFSIKKEFLEVVPAPEKLTPHELFDKHKMYTMLNSEEEPACILISDHKNEDTRDICKKHKIPGFEHGKFHFGEWWVNGKRLQPEEELKKSEGRLFDDAFDKIVNG